MALYLHLDDAAFGSRAQRRMYNKTLRLYEATIKENCFLEPGDVVRFDNGKSYMYYAPFLAAPGNDGIYEGDFGKKGPMVEPAYTALMPEIPVKIFLLRDSRDSKIERFKPYKEGGTMNYRAPDGTEMVIGFINAEWWSHDKVGHLNIENWEKTLALLPEINKLVAATV